MTSRTIAYDASAASYNVAGSGVYTRELATALAERLGDRFVPLSCPGLRVPGDRRTWRERGETVRRDLWWSQVAVARAARSRGAGLLHSPVGVGPAAGGPPLAVTIHDLAVLRFPELFRGWHRRFLTALFPRLARRARVVFTVSEASRIDIVERLGVPADRVVATPLGVDPRFAAAALDTAAVERARDRFALPERYLLVVGALEPRKNIPALLRAMRALAGDPRARDLTLVHAGAPGWRLHDLRAEAESLGVGTRVRFLGFAPDDLLPALYAGATAFAFPSRFEGFGLPVLEAMASGCPVLTSDVSSMPEVAGDAALLVDPDDDEAIADALARIWSDEPLRERLRAAGRRRAARFTWAETARRTAEGYERALA